MKYFFFSVMTVCFTVLLAALSVLAFIAAPVYLAYVIIRKKASKGQWNPRQAKPAPITYMEWRQKKGYDKL